MTLVYGFALRFVADALVSSAEVEQRLRPAIESALAGLATELIIKPIYRQTTQSSLRTEKEKPAT